MGFSLGGAGTCFGRAECGGLCLLQSCNASADLRHRRHRRLLAFQNRAATLFEIGRADVQHRRADHHVGAAQLLLAQALAHDGDGLIHRAQQAGRALAAGAAGDIHRDDELGAELPCRIHRHRADHAAVHIGFAADAHRLEHAGNRTGRTHRLADIAAHEHCAVAGFQLRGDRGKRLAQPLGRLVADLRVDVVLQLLALDQAAGEQAQIADAGFVQRDGFLLHVECVHATGIQRTDHAAGADARHHHRLTRSCHWHTTHRPRCRRWCRTPPPARSRWLPAS
ncbi:hypothetical protein D3C81_1088040 [compost metagenome]